VVRFNDFCLYVNLLEEQIQDVMDEDGVDVESDEETDKIINEIEVQVRGGGGGQKEVQKQQDVNCVTL